MQSVRSLSRGFYGMQGYPVIAFHGTVLIYIYIFLNLFIYIYIFIYFYHINTVYTVKEVTSFREAWSVNVCGL